MLRGRSLTTTSHLFGFPLFTGRLADSSKQHLGLAPDALVAKYVVKFALDQLLLDFAFLYGLFKLADSLQILLVSFTVVGIFLGCLTLQLLMELLDLLCLLACSIIVHLKLRILQLEPSNLIEKQPNLFLLFESSRLLFLQRHNSVRCLHEVIVLILIKVGFASNLSN